MRPGRSAALVVGLLFIAGCGSSSKSASSRTASGPPSTAASSTPAPPSSGSLKITDRVIGAADFPGFSVPPGETPKPVSNVGDWLSLAGGGTTPADAVRLRRLRFVAGVREDLIIPGQTDRGGLSVVEQFPTHAAAATELAANLKGPSGAPLTPFPVSAFPGAHGFGSASVGGYNVAWADGPFFYLVGAGFRPGAANPPTAAQVIAAAHRLYVRVHGRA